MVGWLITKVRNVYCKSVREFLSNLKISKVTNKNVVVSCTLCAWPPLSFMDDVIFAHKPKLLDVAAQLKRSAHAALGLAINCAQ